MENLSPHDYSLENLPAIFAEHAKIADEETQHQIEIFISHNPTEELPFYLKYPFNLPKALSIIAQNILDLNKSSTK